MLLSLNKNFLSCHHKLYFQVSFKSGIICCLKYDGVIGGVYVIFAV